jgi:hypothetical protein
VFFLYLPPTDFPHFYFSLSPFFVFVCVQVRLGTRSSEDLKRFMRTRGPPHRALRAAGIDAEDESDASGKLLAKAKKLLASGARLRETPSAGEVEVNVPFFFF